MNASKSTTKRIDTEINELIDLQNSNRGNHSIMTGFYADDLRNAVIAAGVPKSAARKMKVRDLNEFIWNNNITRDQIWQANELNGFILYREHGQKSTDWNVAKIKSFSAAEATYNLKVANQEKIQTRRYSVIQLWKGTHKPVEMVEGVELEQIKSQFDLEKYVGDFLPRDIRDSFHGDIYLDGSPIAHWLHEDAGHPVIGYADVFTNGIVVTETGYKVSTNGFVSKSTIYGEKTEGAFLVHTKRTAKGVHANSYYWVKNAVDVMGKLVNPPVEGEDEMEKYFIVSMKVLMGAFILKSDCIVMRTM